VDVAVGVCCVPCVVGVGKVVGVFDWVGVGVAPPTGVFVGRGLLVGVESETGVLVGVVPADVGVFVGRRAKIPSRLVLAYTWLPSSGLICSAGLTQALALEVKIQKEMRVIASRKQLASLELPYGRFEGSIQKPFHNSIEMKLYP
jgi:hypothetical protein